MSKALVALGAVAAASALLVPTVAFADPMSTNDSAEFAQASVSYADLNLANPSGVSTLRYRINYAAKSVCGAPFAFEILQNPDRVACINGAVASAQPEFDRVVGAAHRGTVTVTYGASLIVTAPRQ